MAEVFTQFAEPIAGPDGSWYRAQACGAPMADGLWEGWIEFLPIDGSEPIRSPRETTQPNRGDTAYWSTGLTAIYLEGALRRALNPVVRRIPATPRPAFDAPAADSTVIVDTQPRIHDAVLDPFSV